MKSTKFRTILIFVVLLVAAYYLAPLVLDNLPQFWTEKRLKLGLDLQGGMHILMEVDYSELPDDKDEREQAVQSALRVIRNRIDQFGVAEPSIQRVGDNRIVVQLPGLKEFDRAKELIGKTALLEFKLLAEQDQIEETYSKLDKYLKENYDKYDFLKKLELEPEEEEQKDDLFAEGDDSLATDTETLKDSTQADSLGAKDEAGLNKSNLFTYLTTAEGASGAVNKENTETLKKLLKSEDFKKQIPAGIQIALGRINTKNPDTPRPVYFLIDKAELVGTDLETATVQIGQGYDPRTSGKPYVGLEFKKKGAEKFERVTGQNIKKNLAIVLDDVVYSAPQIQNKIRGGKAQITGNFTIEECQDLVIVLKAGNLPAPVNIVQERTVGPTLGADSIDAGFKAAVIGLIIVILFMIIYYGLSGFIADIAVAFNILFILAALTMLEATLTMPGIAGMILTIGMAVDANVLIFERIREELKTGKTVRTSVESGFKRALVTILDANITTLITAVVLYQFGTGPIRGFAVTLSLGIIGAMFAALILVKAIFDGFITNKNRKKLSI